MDEILSALACIPVRTCSYAEWLGIGMALKDAGYACSVWDDWSRDDKRYVEGDCARRWATFKGSDRPITVRTIRAMARKNGWVSALFLTALVAEEDACAHADAHPLSGSHVSAG